MDLAKARPSAQPLMARTCCKTSNHTANPVRCLLVPPSETGYGVQCDRRCSVSMPPSPDHRRTHNIHPRSAGVQTSLRMPVANWSVQTPDSRLQTVLCPGQDSFGTEQCAMSQWTSAGDHGFRHADCCPFHPHTIACQMIERIGASGKAS